MKGNLMSFLKLFLNAMIRNLRVKNIFYPIKD